MKIKFEVLLRYQVSYGLKMANSFEATPCESDYPKIKLQRESCARKCVDFVLSPRFIKSIGLNCFAGTCAPTRLEKQMFQNNRWNCGLSSSYCNVYHLLSILDDSTRKIVIFCCPTLHLAHHNQSYFDNNTLSIFLPLLLLSLSPILFVLFVKMCKERVRQQHIMA